MTDEEKLTRALQALKDIGNPIRRVERGTLPSYKLDGWGYAGLFADPMTYRSWAREALRDMGEAEQ
jgi:hypothetical protein